MSAAGRLWRNAPAWRVWLVVALCSTGLAAMFPPAAPQWLAHRAGTAAPGAVAPSPGIFGAPHLAAAHFSPQPDAPPSQYSLYQPVANPQDLTGVIPFAGRQIPLPQGNWKNVALAQLRGEVPGQAELLFRVENGQLTGVLRAEAPSPGSGAAGVLARPDFCFFTETIMRDTPPEPATQNPMVHECWVLTESTMTGAANRDKVDEELHKALDRLEKNNVSVPEHMLALLYLRSSETGWVRTLLLLPAQRDVTALASRQIQAWVKRYAAALHQGFDGRLAAGASYTALGRDPTL